MSGSIPCDTPPKPFTLASLRCIPPPPSSWKHSMVYPHPIFWPSSHPTVFPSPVLKLSAAPNFVSIHSSLLPPMLSLPEHVWNDTKPFSKLAFSMKPSAQFLNYHFWSETKLKCMIAHIHPLLSFTLSLQAYLTVPSTKFRTANS